MSEQTTAPLPHDLTASLEGLSKSDWLARLSGIARARGAFRSLDRAHFAAYIEGNGTLLVTFETQAGIQGLTEEGQPMGWRMVREEGWSHLCLVSDGDTWFRAPEVYDYIDELIDDGFFEQFDRVLFFGAGPCAYAACAYSVAAPGALVLAIQPQATLNPTLTEWDERFREQRRLDFTSRYGYAPDMLDACARAWVLYDPVERLDAMHAALFARPNVTLFRLRHLGGALQGSLLRMGMLHTLLRLAGEGRLDAKVFATLYRRRRRYPPYLRNLLTALEVEERELLIQALCRNVTARMNLPRFRRRLRDAPPDGAHLRRAMDQLD
ncbi:MAG: phosphoadenosine phosphosulfate reductase [Rhodobacteraceae bacterium]|nr:phosphoadenosine phosphosulfate reductase [Paracoccaceae bacterium]MBR9819418.1 phosphoadenosine phosphosulfate reductase [Paracoccaceae bacterium]